MHPSPIDDILCHNIVKLAGGPRGNSRVDPQTTLTMLWRNSLLITEKMHGKLWIHVAITMWTYSYYSDNVMIKSMITNRTDAWKTDVNLFFMITNSEIVCSLVDASQKLQIHVSVHNWQWKLANACARVPAVIVKR